MPSVIKTGGIFITSKKSSPRIPVEVDGIQVNFCKNPTCANYGVPAQIKKKRRGRSAPSTSRDSYRVIASRKDAPVLLCKLCNEYPQIKSNQGIKEEFDRIGSYLVIEEICWPNSSCTNNSISLKASTSYQSFGKTKSGSPRYRCKACGKTFSVNKKSTIRQRKPHKNREIFSLLMNKMPFRRICEVADISEGSLYPKIDFIHNHCLGFVADRERKLLEGMSIPRLYISVDRQEYVVNWTQRKDKRNTVLSAVGSADNETGYVFGMTLNYDPSLDPDIVEKSAIAAGDYTAKFPFRQFARLWLKGDYSIAVKNSKR